MIDEFVLVTCTREYQQILCACVYVCSCRLPYIPSILDSSVHVTVRVGQPWLTQTYIQEGKKSHHIYTSLFFHHLPSAVRVLSSHLFWTLVNTFRHVLLQARRTSRGGQHKRKVNTGVLIFRHLPPAVCVCVCCYPTHCTPVYRYTFRYYTYDMVHQPGVTQTGERSSRAFFFLSLPSAVCVCRHYTYFGHPSALTLDPIVEVSNLRARNEPHARPTNRLVNAVHFSLWFLTAFFASV